MPDASSPADPDQPLRDLLAECIDRIGESGSLTAAEALLELHPEHAATLRERLGKLLRAGLLPLGEPSTATPTQPERLGDFRLLRPLGRGGMGVVYLARQESLDREVAIKLVHPELLYFPGARERFRREVEAIARLQDPGIVPIYTVGEDAGVPYFAMEHIVGASLAEVVADLRGRAPDALTGADFAAIVSRRADRPVQPAAGDLFAGGWIEVCCRVVHRMALAVHHAHDRGVLHRDLKPSNAMVTPDGRVLVLDFGLATAEGSPSLTRSGGLVGTLDYMPPEQVRGDAVDVRVDVYSLGATLHQLLTLQTPHRGSSSEALRQAILDGTVGPLAQHNRAAPRDVDTICRKALANEADQRYATAAELADDLGRFLAHRPIRARPASLALRARRWSRRHPAATVALLLSVFGAATTFVLSLQRDSALDESQANLRRAVQAISVLVERAQSLEMSQTPGLDPMRARQLDDAVAMLTALSQENAHSDVARHALARGLVEASSLRRDLGQGPAATAACDLAATILDQLLAARPGDRELTIDLARATLTRSILRREAADLAGAAAGFGRVLDLVAPFAAPEDDRVLSLRCAALHDLAQLDVVAGDLVLAEQRLVQVRELDARRLQIDRSYPTLTDVARDRTALASLRQKRGDAAAALTEFEAVAALFDELLTLAPDNPELRREQARAKVGAAKALGGLQRFPEAVSAARSALERFAALTARFPQRTQYEWERNMVELELAQLAEAGGDDAVAATTLRAALQHHEDLLVRQATQKEMRSEAAVMASRLATILQRTGGGDEVATLLERAIALQAPLLADDPRDPHWRGTQIKLYNQLAKECLERDQPERAVTAFQQMLALTAADHAAEPSPRHREVFAYTLQMLAVAQAAADDTDAAMRTLERLQEQAPLPRDTLSRLGNDLHLDEREDFRALLAKAGG